MTNFYLSKKYFTVLLFLMITTIVWSQSRTVTGKVISSEDGSGLPGVNILEKGTSNGTITSVDGTYSIAVAENATLVFSFVGYKGTEIAVGSQSAINITLEADVTALSEVVVIGYGQVERKDATGAIASLKPTDFNAGVIASPEQLMQGRMPGVQITSASGEPGAAVNVRIRGTSSVRSGNNPLFVVDGVPLAGDDPNATTTGIANGALGNSTPRNPLNFLNPNDIASIDVLKDASATAIYGSRGANGVVLITTKSGKSGKATLDYSYNLSLSTITKKYDVLDRNEFLSAYAGYHGAAAAAQIDKGASTDWQDEVLRTAVSHNHNISYGGGDQTGDYRFSFSYLDQAGIVKHSNLKRYTARFNGTKKFIDNRLTIGTQISVGDTHDDNVPITNNSGYEGDLFGSAIKANPTAPVYYDTTDSQGNSYHVLYQPTNVEPNPVAMLELTKSYTNTLRALGNLSAEVQILKGFTFKTVIGFDRSFSSRKSAFSRDLNASQGIYGIGRLYLNDMQTYNKLWENYFTYDKTFGTGLKFNALAGYSYQSFSIAGQNFQFAHFRVSDLDVMINNFASADQKPTGDAISGYGVGVLGTNSSKVTDELQSFFGRVNFGIQDKYIITATLRADGSTRFGGNNKYGYFPSAAFKWRLGDEEFVPELFADLNLRLGYGVTGNQEIPHNVYQQRQRYGVRYADVNTEYNINNGGLFEGGGLENVSFYNPDLKWESTSQFNAGVDFGFLGSRIRGSVDYYYKNTNDLLIQAISAQPAPQPFVWRNLDANVINRGVEILLEADAVNSANFKWTVIGNVAFNKNVVKNLGTKNYNTGEANGQGLSGAFTQKIANNQPLYAFYLRRFAGYDENGINVYAGGDVQTFTGQSPLPKANAGLTNNFNYKNFDLSIFFSGQFGQYIYNNTANAYFTGGSLANGRNVTKNVVGNGESNLNAPDVSTRFLENGSFVRLQSVSVGYNVSTKNTIISSLRVFLSGQNLFVITDYSGQDPEVNVNKALNGVPSAGIDYAAYPRARTFTLGVNASF